MTECANCEWTIDGTPALVAGTAFCCTGCAAGGPCRCAYGTRASLTSDGEPAADTPAAGRSRPAGWSLLSRDRVMSADHDDETVLPEPRRARLGTDGA